MNKVLEVLKNARTLLTDPAHWTQGALARDITGTEITSEIATTDKDVTCWCLEGAIACAAYRLGDSEEASQVVQDAYSVLRSVLNTDRGVWKFNDSDYTTHPMVLELLDKAIVSEEVN